MRDRPTFVRSPATFARPMQMPRACAPSPTIMLRGIDDLDRPKLAKVLARLGSAYAGERDAAAFAAEAMRQQAHVSWDEIVNPVKAEAAPPPPSPPNGDAGDWRRDLDHCLAHRAKLNEWELHFCLNLRSLRTASEKQQAKLKTIIADIERRPPVRRKGGHANAAE